MSRNKELQVAINAVRAAAEVCQHVQSGITPEALEKRDRSPVTVADFASQAIICREIQAHFPDDVVIGEEDAAELREESNAIFLERVASELARVGVEGSNEDICGWIDRGGANEYTDRFWTLDPIDGTKGFLRGEQYAISLALIVEGQIEVAVLGCPNLALVPGDEATAGTVLTAIRGQGATAQRLDGSDSRSINVSATDDGAKIRFCESVESGHSSHSHSAQVASALGITLPPVRLDSQAKYAVVARGEADVYLRLPTRADYVEKIWDHAGGVLVVQEAGGTVTDVAGKPLEFTHGRGLAVNRGVVVSNGPLHDQIIAELKSLGVE